MQKNRKGLAAALGEIALGCVLALPMAGSALGQAFPNKPISFIYASGAGSMGDVMMRAISASASRALGQPIVVENRPAAGGRGAPLAMKERKGDPYQIAGVTGANIVTLPLADPSVQLEPGKDYIPLWTGVGSYYVLVAHPSLGVRDIKGLLAYAKANPGKLNAGNSSLGGIGHLGLLQFGEVTGLQATPITYKGEGQTIPPVLSGEVQMAFLSGAVKPHIDAGRMIPLATTGPARWNQFPNVPTAIESGVPNFTLGYWIGVITQVDIPKDAQARLFNAYNGSLTDPDITKRAFEYGMVIIGDTTEQFTRRVQNELALYGPIIKRLGLKLE